MKKRTVPVMDLRIKLKISRARALQRKYTRSGPTAENRIMNVPNRKLLRKSKQSLIPSRPNTFSFKERLGPKSCDDEQPMLVSNDESKYDQPPPLIPAEMWPSFDRPAVSVPNEMHWPRQPPSLIPRETWTEIRSLGLASPELNNQKRVSQDRFQSAPVLWDSSAQIKLEVDSEGGDALHDVDQRRQSHFSSSASYSGYSRQKTAGLQSRNPSRSHLPSEGTSTENRRVLAQDRGSFQYNFSPQGSRLDNFNSSYSSSCAVPQRKKMSTSEKFSTNLSRHLSQNPSAKHASFESRSLTPIACPSPALSSGLPNREELIPLTPLPFPDSVAENSAVMWKPKVFCTKIPLCERFKAYSENYNNMVIKEEESDYE
ncbi:hypothetical protein QYM36_004924 [Artemia franciscana]|nr:hypothetical protein QYM36_004924 [Artemia franciscana]KAK2719269.1 hypothetical protein QYM36_004924 [Artemia franciscana]